MKTKNLKASPPRSAMTAALMAIATGAYFAGRTGYTSHWLGGNYDRPSQRTRRRAWRNRVSNMRGRRWRVR